MRKSIIKYFAKNIIDYLHVEIIEDPHKILDEYVGQKIMSSNDWVMAKSKLCRYRSRYRMVNIISTFLSTISIYRSCKKEIDNKGCIFVREYWNVPLLMLSPIFIPLRHKVYFNVNHNASKSRDGLHYSFYLVLLFRFKVVVFDGEEFKRTLPQFLSKHVHTPLFPVVLNKYNGRKAQNVPLRLGFVGEFRTEKMSFFELLNVASDLAKTSKYSVKIGTRDIGKVSHIQENGIDAVLTQDRDSYMNYLCDLDVLVVMATEKYYFRNSGTIIDAIVSNTIPIVPDMPVFKSQVNNPCSVGLVYKDIASLVEVLGKVDIKYLRNNFSHYLEVRSDENFMRPNKISG